MEARLSQNKLIARKRGRKLQIKIQDGIDVKKLQSWLTDNVGKLVIKKLGQKLRC